MLLVGPKSSWDSSLKDKLPFSQTPPSAGESCGMVPTGTCRPGDGCQLWVCVPPVKHALRRGAPNPGMAGLLAAGGNQTGAMSSYQLCPPPGTVSIHPANRANPLRKKQTRSLLL